ncbi:Dorsal-ventral patterning protein tolloid, partial [Taenia solium]
AVNPSTFTCGPGTSEVMIDSDTSGVFHSPGWPTAFTPDSRCLFRFVAPPGRKVLIEFANFHIEGLYPYQLGDPIPPRGVTTFEAEIVTGVEI